MRNAVRFEDPKHLHKLIKSWTLSKLEYGPKDLLVFMDETGNPKLNDQHRVFGIGGCAVMGQDYDTIVKPAWRKLKSDLFGLSSKTNFHASHHLHRATDEQIVEVARLISLPQIKKFATVIYKEAPVDQGASVLSAVSSSVSNTVRQLISADCECDHWIFEHSDNMSRLSIVSLMEGSLPAFHLGNLSKQSRGLSLFTRRMPSRV